MVLATNNNVTLFLRVVYLSMHLMSLFPIPNWMLGGDPDYLFCEGIFLLKLIA